MLEKRKQQLAATALCLLMISCGRDEPTAPAAPDQTMGSLDVAVVTSGGDPDRDGYGVQVDTTMYALAATRQDSTDVVGRVDLVIPQVPAGSHSVTLKGIASNCVLDGANPQQFAVTAGQKTVVTLTVTCLATGIEVTAHTTGFDNPPSYDLVIDGHFSGAVGANDSSAATRLQPGSHVLTLGVRGENCDVANGRQVTVTVSNRAIVPVSFDVACTHAVRRERIAYAVDTTVDGMSGTWIVLINPDGSGAAPVVKGDQPTWSPDGTKLAYSNTLCPVYAQYYGEPCGGGIGVIDPELWSGSALRGGAGGLDPAWSPDGGTIAFRLCCSTGDSGRIYLTSVDGSRPDSSLDFSPVSVSEPSWSPDGQHIALTCATLNGGNSNLCIVRKDSAGHRQLNVATADQASPAWSPDGSRIAFTRGPNATGKLEVALLDVGTLSVTALTEGYDPAWSPDGTKLVVANGDGLYVINADGTRKTRITQGGQHAPAWRR